MSCTEAPLLNIKMMNAAMNGYFCISTLRNQADQHFLTVRVDTHHFNGTKTAVRISGICPLRSVSTLCSLMSVKNMQAAHDLCTEKDHRPLCFGLSVCRTSVDAPKYSTEWNTQDN